MLLLTGVSGAWLRPRRDASLHAMRLCCAAPPPPQALLPHLRDLEAWLFGEVVKHLWWRVLLPGVTTPPPHGSSPSSSGAAGSSGGGGGRPGPAAPFAAQNGSGGGEAASSASLQGTPRSFETPEVGGAA